MKSSIKKLASAANFPSRVTAALLSMTVSWVIPASGLLAGSSAYAQAAPDWSACIGTGHTASMSETATTITPAARLTVQAPALVWSAFIGTGKVSADSDRRPHAPLALDNAASQLKTHWTSGIGNGHAFDAAYHAVSERTAHVVR
jgi:hypothetical protein